MKEFKILEIKESVFEDNNLRAEKLRRKLKEEKKFLINLMASPGAGKTTLLTATINALKSEFNIGVLEADIDSAVDAETIFKTGAKVIQVHTGGMCHLDADMTEQGLNALETDNLDLIFLENIGNLICPAEFDTGASKNVMILSVPEGDDKPLKYPLMFKICDVLLITKMDACEFFNFSLENCTKYVKKINPNIKIIPVAALKNEGLAPWLKWIKEEISGF